MVDGIDHLLEIDRDHLQDMIIIDDQDREVHLEGKFIITAAAYRHYFLLILQKLLFHFVSLCF